MVEQGPTDQRFLSREDCAALKKRLMSYTTGGGTVEISIDSSWNGNVRWGRNQVSSSGDSRDVQLTLRRNIRGASAMLISNDTDDASLRTLVRRSEQLVRWGDEYPETGQRELPQESYLQPRIWSDATYNLSAQDRAAAMRTSIQSADKGRMFSAGYLEVTASGQAFMHSRRRDLYYPQTKVSCSITMRDPSTNASGWAGTDHYDWSRIDVQGVAETALNKCLLTRNPGMIEPARYTVVLEPQAVADFFDPLITSPLMDRSVAESSFGWGPFSNRDGTSKIGEKIFDERITVTSDPMDPDLGFVPFDHAGNAYRPAVWFERGVLRNLAYDRNYGIRKLGVDTGLPNAGAYRISGGTTTTAEMIATTRRGLLITRFSNVGVLDLNMMLFTGFTRDGVWLIENGRTRPVRNFRFSETLLLAFNNVEAIGPAVRVFHPNIPVVAPSMKIRDFNFVGIADAL